MQKSSRTKNSFRNSIFASLMQTTTIILQFVVRTVFIRTLSSEYLGINGLFSNIITMLSLADLGIGISMPYMLYKPIADKDEGKITTLMNLYSKIYIVIGLAVLLIGVSLTSLLPYIIKEIPNIPNLNIIYVLFVINSAVSYFFVYKKILLDSDQKGYIASKITIVMTVLKSIIEIIILLLTRNYIMYLVTAIIIVVFQNFIISHKCNKLYPYIKDKKNIKQVDKEDITKLKKNTSALVLYRIGTVALNGTDNIIISKIIGITAVGLYSNYMMIFNAVHGIINKMFEAITASIGNLVVTENREKSENVLYKVQFLCFILYAFVAIIIATLINPFIRIWIGNKYLFDNYVSFAIGLNLYIYGMQSVVSSYRNAYGLFVHGKYRPIIMTIVNIIVSIILAKYIGILGVVIGTIVSRLFIMSLYDPYIVYKYGIKKSVNNYFKKYFSYLSLYLIISITLCYGITKFTIKNIFQLFISGFAIAGITMIIFYLVYRKSENFSYYISLIKSFIKKRGRVK